jgi:hypothetical protein
MATQGVDDSNPAAVFGLAAKELEKLKPAFVELRQPGRTAPSAPPRFRSRMA